MVNDNTCGICKPHLDKFGGLFDAPENSPECASRVLHSPDVVAMATVPHGNLLHRVE